jgi:hypothetical protein
MDSEHHQTSEESYFLKLKRIKITKRIKKRQKIKECQKKENKGNKRKRFYLMTGLS